MVNLSEGERGLIVLPESKDLHLGLEYPISLAKMQVLRLHLAQMRARFRSG